MLKDKGDYGLVLLTVIAIFAFVISIQEYTTSGCVKGKMGMEYCGPIGLLLLFIIGVITAYIFLKTIRLFLK